MLKIKLHSVTDLITNSSTVIFTYSEGTVKPFKEMINEIIKVFGSTLTCDDMFDTVVLCDDYYPYSEYFDRHDDGEEYPDGVDENTDFKKLFEDVASGKLPKPDWFNRVEEDESYGDYYAPSTSLYLIPKDEKYRKMGNLIESFLYSTSHEATRDG
jgi:hypothetical protein